MSKTILITGATDGIGLATARTLVAQGHRVLLHGRNPTKLEQSAQTLAALPGAGPIDSHVADLSRFADVAALAGAVRGQTERLDVLINNAGVLKTGAPRAADGLDVRFVVNTFAPFLLTRLLWPLLGASARVINLSSAAQSPVDIQALAGQRQLSDMDAYAQSKLALTMWSRRMGLDAGDQGPVVVAVNPGSLLATKMVREGFGMAGSNVGKGADILVRAALSDEFAHVSGQYFDNDAGRFASPHADALDSDKVAQVVRAIEAVLSTKAAGDTDSA